MARRREGRLIENEIAVLGFGYMRSFTANPRFCSQDLVRSQADLSIASPMHESTVNRAFHSLESMNLLQVNYSSPKPFTRERPRLYAQTTELSEEALMFEVLDRMRLDKLLVFPEVVQTVFTRGNILDQVVQLMTEQQGH